MLKTYDFVCRGLRGVARRALAYSAEKPRGLVLEQMHKAYEGI
jgi:hypothetical protein